jgi:carbamoyltransferase
VIADRAADFFDIEDPTKHYPYRFMLYVAQVHEDKKKYLDAITHVDGTARLQTSTKRPTGLLQMIQRFGEGSGYPVVLNTSFNLKGEPIVEHPSHAFNTFSLSGMDVLFLENYVVGEGGEEGPAAHEVRAAPRRRHRGRDALVTSGDRAKRAARVRGALLGWVVSLALFVAFASSGCVCSRSTSRGRRSSRSRAPTASCGWVKIGPTRPRRARHRRVQATYFRSTSSACATTESLPRAKPARDAARALRRRLVRPGLHRSTRRTTSSTSSSDAFRRRRPRVESVNGGTEGWSDRPEVRLAAEGGLSLRPDAVVFCFFQNDVWGDQSASYTGCPSRASRRRARLDGERPAAIRRSGGWFATHTCLGGSLPRLGDRHEVPRRSRRGNMGADEPSC